MEHQRVEALLELSGLHPTSHVVEMLHIAQTAPDPETAISQVIDAIHVQSPLLENKWRKHIAQMWFASHPNVPTCFSIPLKSSDIAYSMTLLEAHNLLEEVSHESLTTERTSYGLVLARSEEERLTQALPVFRGDVRALRRMFALLEELRLIRLYQQRFHIVRSRAQRFNDLPLPAQFYLLWHADMYHLDWRQYEPEYGSALAVFQQYLPMVWEMLMHRQEGMSQRIDELTWQVVRAFRPLWHQQHAGLYEQSLLQHMVETHLIQKALARYGLISYDDDMSFTWTSAGEALLTAERTTTLPCTSDLLA